MNNNPIQFVPIELHECKSLTIINLAHTNVKFLPRELFELSKLFLLDLAGCPLKGKIADVYP